MYSFNNLIIYQAPLRISLPDDWPLWTAVLVQLIIIIFRSKLIEMLPNVLRAKWQSAAEQELYIIKSNADYQRAIAEKRLLLEEVELGGALQSTATGALRSAKLDDNLYSLITRQMDFAEGMMKSGIQDQNNDLSTLYQELKAVRQTMTRLTDLNAAILSCLMKSNGEQMVAISTYVSGIMDEVGGCLRKD